MNARVQKHVSGAHTLFFHQKALAAAMKSESSPTGPVDEGIAFEAPAFAASGMGFDALVRKHGWVARKKYNKDVRKKRINSWSSMEDLSSNWARGRPSVHDILISIVLDRRRR